MGYFTDMINFMITYSVFIDDLGAQGRRFKSLMKLTENYPEVNFYSLL